MMPRISAPGDMMDTDMMLCWRRVGRALKLVDRVKLPRKERLFTLASVNSYQTVELDLNLPLYDICLHIGTG